MSLISILACPVCGGGLAATGKQYRCPQGHSYDMARQGYLNLLVAQHKRSRAPGDGPEMVLARRRFLEQGHYQPIASAFADFTETQLQAAQQPSLQVADVGCGEGYYSGQLQQRLNSLTPTSFYGIDIAREAVKLAARSYPEITWLVASGGRLPLLAGQLDAVVSLFTPIMPESWHKALRSAGSVLLVTAGINHLIELRELLYSEVRTKLFDPTPQMSASGFRAIDNQRFQQRVHIPAEALDDLLIMTPHGWRVTAETRERLQQLNGLTVTLDVNFYHFENQITPQSDQQRQ